MRTSRVIVVVAAVVVAIASVSPARAGSSGRAPSGPPRLRLVRVLSAEQPVGFTFTPSGKIVYLERASGRLRSFDPRSGRARTLFRFTRVDVEGERGALGVALHPGWPDRSWIYAFVTREAGGTLRNQVVRVRRSGRGFEVLLNLPIGGRANHNGGRILFGPDGNLYVIVGDGGEDPGTAQDLAERRGKVLRLAPNGSVAPGNPFASYVWAYGIRNSIGLAFDPRVGSLWETENGPACNDEINVIQEGQNHAWGPLQDCGSAAAPLDTNADGPDPKILPVAWFEDTLAVTGIAFCRGCGLGRPFRGRALFACANGNCRRDWRGLGLLRPNAARDGLAAPPQPVPNDHGGPLYSVERAPDGRLYASDPTGIYRIDRR
jgi:glucose/arabinose dehydrogenase